MTILARLSDLRARVFGVREEPPVVPPPTHRCVVCGREQWWPGVCEVDVALYTNDGRLRPEIAAYYASRR